MKDITLVLLGGGSSNRFRENFPVKKQWLYVEDEPLWLFVAKKFNQMFDFSKVIIVSSTEEINYMKNFSDDFLFVKGGKERQDSLKNALGKVDTEYVLVSDIARACVPYEMVKEIIKNKQKADCIVPVLDVHDTVVYEAKTIDRDKVKLVQTPQLSKTKILKKALDLEKIYTDDSSAIKAIGGSIFFTKGSKFAKKITYIVDLEETACLKPPANLYFVGSGYDVHRFCEDREMYLCGVKIDSPFGFEAHSDGDVAIHALIDSLLGAIGAGDIGELFPDSNEEFKDIDSKILLKRVVDFIKAVGLEIVNVDVTIIAQTPKLSSYKKEMRRVLADILGIKPIRVNIKATTTEKLGFVGRKEGVAVEAVSNIKIYDWKRR